MTTLIVSYLVHSHTNTPYGQRIWSDGKAEGYQTTQIVKQPDGKFSYQPIQPNFYPIAKLSPAQVEAIQRDVEQVQLATMRDQVRTPTPTEVDRESIVWQTALSSAAGEDVHTVKIMPWPPAANDPSFALMALISRIGTIILAAQTGQTEVPVL